MPIERDDASQDDPRLNEILAEYLQAAESGGSADPAELIRKHPEYADELREFLADKGQIDRVAGAANIMATISGESGTDPHGMPTRGSQTAIDAPTIDSVAPSKAGPRPGTVLRYFGDYELLEEIARGGMGVVYKARQVKLNRTVAIKMILSGRLASKEDVQRFYTEAEAAAGLEHPGIVPIFEVGEHDGQHYFSMGFVEGESLAVRLAGSPLPPREAAELVQAVAQAVQYAHDKGVIHRDLKPANILLDRDGVPKITDFGLAKQTAVESGMTTSGQILGTPSYMPPEQAAGRIHDVGATADVYSIGAILYATLTGRPPFQADNPLDTLMQVLEREPVSPRQLNPSVPRDLETICLKCLDKDRRRRYQSAQALADELQRFLEGRPIAARPLGRPARTWRWCRRNPVVASLILLTVCLLLGGTIISSVLAVLAIRERERAEQNAVAANRARDDATEARDDARQQERESRRRAYISDINLIQQSLALGKMDQARRLLHAQIPEPGQEDERRWEWRYLWQQCRNQAEQLTKEGDSIRVMRVSHDGRWMAYNSAVRRAVSVWDLAARREVKVIPHVGPGLCSSPVEPLFALVPQNQPTAVLLWDPAENRVMKMLEIGARARMMEFSGDGKFLVANTGQEVVRWRVADWQEVKPRTPAPDLWILEGGQFAVNATGNLAAYRTERDVILLDLDAGQTRWRRNASAEIVSALAFSPDGKMLASAAAWGESTIRLWNVEDGTELGRLIGHRAWVSDLEFIPGENRLVSSSADRSIRIWDLTRPELPLTVLSLRGHDQEVWQVQIVDEKSLISGGKDGTILTWNLDQLENTAPLRISPHPVEHWSFASDGESIVTVDKQGRVERLPGPDYDETELLFELGAGSVTSANGPRQAFGVCFSGDGRLLASYVNSGKIVVWNIDERAVLCELPIAREFDARPTMFVDDGEKLLVSYLGQSTVHLWNLRTGKEEPFPSLRSFRRGSWTLSADEQWILGLQLDGVGELKNLRSGQTRQLQLDCARAVDGAFNPDNSLFAIASQVGYAKLWSTDSFAASAQLTGFLGGVNSVTFSPDGTRLATGSVGVEAVKLWDTRSGRELLNMEGKGSLFYPIRFSKDGNLLASGPRHGPVHIWRAPSWEEIAAAEGKAAVRTNQPAGSRRAATIVEPGGPTTHGPSTEHKVSVIRGISSGINQMRTLNGSNTREARMPRAPTK